LNEGVAGFKLRKTKERAMKETGWIGGAVAATIVMVPSIAMACSAAMQAHNAMMHGKPPDCYDRNTLAIYGPRALTDGKPPAAWLAREKRKAAKAAKSNGQ
jgi:hypothetical protein